MAKMDGGTAAGICGGNLTPRLSTDILAMSRKRFLREQRQDPPGI